jgi:hypothetical protein
MPGAERQSVDSFLEQQSSVSSLFATVEPTESDVSKVKVTPWVAERGCLCSQALTVSKNAIEALTPTGDTHICCGKNLKVVEVQFKEGETIALSDVFLQLRAATSQGAAHHHVSYKNRELATQFPYLPETYGPEFYRRTESIAPRRAVSLNPFRWAHCFEQFNDCMEHCFYSDNVLTCTCNCDNVFKLCTGVGRLQKCPE